MELTRVKRLCVIFLFLITVKEINGKKPEQILIEVLTKPFVPRDFASSDCIRDSNFYLKGFETYKPWALQSEYIYVMVVHFLVYNCHVT